MDEDCEAAEIVTGDPVITAELAYRDVGNASFPGIPKLTGDVGSIVSEGVECLEIEVMPEAMFKIVLWILKRRQSVCG